MTCPFCEKIAAGHILTESPLAVAIPDGHPISPCHTLIVPRRHEADFFKLTDDERSAIWALVPVVRAIIEAETRPDGYNIGVNVGAAAGQTVQHVHLHVIPRCHGDSPDPRGGIRWVLPAKARYWK
ncbi:MAG: HIT family protein [Deltaproteobacteria bacterium]|nr:HIT family protein [Deltaproteobacteria bacterium]